MTAILVGIFGVSGALLRFSVDSWFAHHQGSRPHWPWATLAVNVVGSFIIGISLGLTGHLELGADWHAAVASGLAGGLTTFSSWTTATVRLVSETRYRAAALNIGSNLVAGLAAAGIGLFLAG
ncbi:fluoride efflux transporter FluC [Arthrobacter oryzae]|uniref:Fluoride-specific ion channel FluC n=1 Tax=Arthrobacter oryzae TaxID=409290 RepID=A0A495ETG8_9MICC|nr:CrcB family protein [Arthrobacter oryzae]RKR20304.1 protein CrcB [Arthrobacter oryzae]